MGLPPAYVLDEMETYEMRALLQHRDYSARTSWEQTRQIVYTMAQTHSSKQLCPRDIMEFTWEKEGNDKKETTAEDVKRLRQQAAELLQKGLI